MAVTAVPVCEHIKSDGVRCGSPAMHRNHFCYMHRRLRDYKRDVTDENFEIPLIDSEASIVLASLQIMRAIFAGKLDAGQARAATSCLKVAAHAMRNQLNVKNHTELFFTGAMADEFALQNQPGKPGACAPIGVIDEEPSTEEPEAALPAEKNSASASEAAARPDRQPARETVFPSSLDDLDHVASVFGPHLIDKAFHGSKAVGGPPS